MHAGKDILMRYDPAAQKLVVMSEPQGDVSYAKLKFSPPPNKVKNFAAKEDNVRACVSKSNMGTAVTKPISEWVEAIALEKSDKNVENSPKTLHFKVRSDVDNEDADIPISVTLTQSPERWTIIVRHEGPDKVDFLRTNRPLAAVILDRVGRTESISKWRADINQAISEIMHTRNVLIACVLAANR